MDGRFDDTHLRHYSYVLPTSSSSNYTYFSEQAITHRLWSGTSVQPMVMREEVYGDVGIHHRFEQREMMMMHGRYSQPENITPFVMPFRERYGYGGGHRDIREYEAVPLQMFPLPSPNINNVLGKQTGAIVPGWKQIAPAPSSPSVAGSSETGVNDSEKVIEEWRCAMCEISVTSERGLKEHLDGKKHQIKVESLKRNGRDIGLGAIQTYVKKQPAEGNMDGDIGLGLGIKSDPVKSKKVKMSNGGSRKRNFELWCKICQVGAHDENVMSEHKKGQKHRKNLRKKAKARALAKRNS